MKRTIAWILVLVLCLGVFAGCTKTPVASTNPGTTAGAAENEGLLKAAKYLKALYNTAPVETGIDFERTTIVPVGTVQYTVTWAVDVAEDLVKIVAGENNTVVIDVNEDNQTETAYKLTATVSDKDGNKKEVVFDHILPKAVAKDGTEFSVAEIIAMGAAKEHNTYTDYKYKVTGVITEVYNTQYGNMKITDDAGNILTIYGTFSADGTLRYDAMDVKPVAGDTVTIYGIVGQYNGTPQIKNGWIVKINGSAPSTEPVTPPAPPASNLSVVDSIEAGKAYKFGMIHDGVSTTTVYYINGEMAATYYFNTVTDPAAGLDIYFEETSGGYYMYTTIGGAKKYINMEVSGTHVNGKYQDTAVTVYTWNADLKTVVTDIDGTMYGFGTRNDKTYTTVGPVRMDGVYYCKFYA
jgi:hypothetical protein